MSQPNSVYGENSFWERWWDKGLFSQEKLAGFVTSRSLLWEMLQGISWEEEIDKKKKKKSRDLKVPKGIKNTWSGKYK